jgi:acetylornithine deacetylase/succinyl-diaminopimelate desuccinylase-like protein
MPSSDKIKFIIDTLSELIQINTTNPPGNETPAAKLVAEVFSEGGVEYEVLESEPGRGSVVAWADSGESGPSLLLLSHLDVVPAKPEEWSVDPFSGIVRDGFVWGRGALDDKLSVAVMLRVFLDLIGSKRFGGRLIYAATADEEMGGKRGVGWLVEKRPELVRADYVLNEGGGFEVTGRRGSVFLVQIAEKGVYSFKLTFRGAPGHASMPKCGDNALLKASQAALRIASHPPPPDVKPYVKLMLERIGEIQGGLPEAMVDAITHNTLAPTVVGRCGEKVNVIPSLCELSVDCRLLPGYGEEWVRSYVSELLGGLSYELEILHREAATESPIDTALFKAIERAVAAEAPGSLASPYMSTGATDSRFFRRIFGSVAYGFIPLRSDLPLEERLKMIHGVNERVSTKNVEFCYRTTLKALENFYALARERLELEKNA